ncbi:ABC transporter substrate-binding protein [Methanocella sp. CWC-04]|uniref:ABC transporter substrate-binding protein n=1 Tax=Methanooceanicella nereidis TaxID=2052831 RepID=A0AAP2RC54_9EURY|nr:ABC transporter substrate-binding protein [Methanocella sp. CWC-04]MCD1293855.1 ABC transporter substrate-binding protein [Methanocella sp. CWC-04]
MDKRFGRKLATALMIFIATAAILVAGCTQPETTATPTPTTGEPITIVSMVSGEPESLDPAYDYESAGGEIIQNVYETLIFYEGSDITKPVGVLAKSWDISEDGLTYTFHLQEGVKFHDGTAFNASAVKYSFDRGVIMNLDPWQAVITPLLYGGSEYMNSEQSQADIDAYLAKETVKVIDENTVQVKLAKPYRPFLDCLAFYAASIISPSYDQANGGYKPNEQSEFMTEHMCGTGPLKFVSWDHMDKITMVKNDDYWGTPAKCDKVIVRYVEDWNTRFLAMKKGEADIIYAPFQYANDILAEPDFVLEAGDPTVTVSYIGFNQNASITPMFTDKRVRQAFIESFDTETFVNVVNLGYGKIPNGPIPEGLPGYNPSIPKQKFDPEHAKQLLIDAGYSKSKPTSVILYYNAGNDGRKSACLMLKDQIEKYDLGISVDVQELDWPTYVKKNRDKELPIFYLGWIADYPSADSFIEPFCVSYGYYADKVSYVNETIDGIYADAKWETDQAKQTEAYTQIIEGTNEDCAYIWTAQAVEFQPMRKELKGYWYNPMNSNLIYYTLYK